MEVLETAVVMILVDREFVTEEEDAYDVAYGEFDIGVEDNNVEAMAGVLRTLLLTPEELVGPEDEQLVSELTVYDILPFLAEERPVHTAAVTAAFEGI
jgi:hypothetical protein